MKQNAGSLDRDGLRGIVRDFLFIIIGAVILFMSAGTASWLGGWIYIGITALYQLVYVVVLLFLNPQLLNERGRLDWKNTKPHDKLFVVLYPLLGLPVLIISGFDAVRFKWSFMQSWTIIPAASVFALLSLFVLWAYVSNASFILTSRDDKLDKQPLCKVGPYRIVRHPAYLGAAVTALCAPFMVGSWYAIAPSVLIVILVVARTYFEDKVLKWELKGYSQYCKETRYRLIPFVW